MSKTTDTVLIGESAKVMLVSEFLEVVEKLINEYYVKVGFLHTSIKLTAEPGSKYIRIVMESRGSRSAYCFLDRKGNIYKSATWKAPATKHIRGTVFDPNCSFGKGLGPYGASYMR